MAGSSGEAFPSKIWDWAYDQIPKVAAKYRDVERVELQAELARELLAIRRKITSKPRDWKAYLFTCLLNGASRFAKEWRKRHDLEPSLEAASATFERFEPSERLQTVNDATAAVIALQQRVGNADRRLLKRLRACEGNVSRLARELGLHRNTIHRRLRKIRTKCPIEIETAPAASGAAQPAERAQLAAIVQSPLSSVRQVLRARVMLALLDGLTYAEIVRRLGTSRSTIARWRPRFVDHGMSGLKVNHPGRKPSPNRARLVRQLRDVPPTKGNSARRLAREFGLGKSTAYRILKLVRDGAVPRAKTL